MSPRFFSGRECWVYRANALAELCGHHPDLIEQAPGEIEPEYLLYSPLRETNRGPFGLEGPSGSHALALTAKSLIISRDPHRADEQRTVVEIPLTSVLIMALGEMTQTTRWSLLDALMFVADDAARRIALEALGHRSFIVRRAAAHVLAHIDRSDLESPCGRREP
jgi:hypothetical protein